MICYTQSKGKAVQIRSYSKELCPILAEIPQMAADFSLTLHIGFIGGSVSAASDKQRYHS